MSGTEPETWVFNGNLHYCKCMIWNFLIFLYFCTSHQRWRGTHTVLMHKTHLSCWAKGVPLIGSLDKYLPPTWRPRVWFLARECSCGMSSSVFSKQDQQLIMMKNYLQNIEQFHIVEVLYSKRSNYAREIERIIDKMEY